MLPTKADTLTLSQSVFLQTSPTENSNQTPGWPLARRKRGYRAWDKMFVQIFFQIFFLNLVLFIGKEGKSEKAGLE